MRKYRRFTSALLALILVLSVLLTGCDLGGGLSEGGGESVIDLDSVPAYSGKPYVAINDNVPFFTEEEIVSEGFESFSELDGLGRAGVALSCIGREVMPDDPREGSLSTNPSGWLYNGKSNNNSYDSSIVSGGYIYNRCHLIGFQLTGEMDNKLNLITGTRYLNIDGMLDFEDMVADYVKETGNHVMYRVTPIYDGMNLLASGVLMEAWSVEDEGDGVCFCIYAYNVQPGIEINYFNGTNRLAGTKAPEDEENEGGVNTDGIVYVFILNTNKTSMKIHLESCSYAKDWSTKSHMVKFEGTVSELLSQYPDYTQCGSCKALDKAK